MAKAPQGSTTAKRTRRGKENGRREADPGMRPVDFDGHFGWLHTPSAPTAQSSGNGSAAPKVGIVLCSPLGHEALWLHQTMRSFSDRLAARGFAVLRFDYLGTGDSVDIGGLLDPTRWADEAVEAAAFLKRASGVERIALVGFRFGAMVAAHAARAASADTVALVAPVVAGRQYLRELSVMQRTWLDTVAEPVRAEPIPAAAHDVMGHRFNRASMDEVGKLDLRRADAPPAPRMLIVHAAAQGPSHELATAYAQLGADVDALPFPEYAEALQPSWQSTLPQATLGALEDWFVRKFAGASKASARAASAARVTALPVFPARRPSDHGIAPGQNVAVETPVELANGRLFGFLCEPSGSERAPLVVIANTATTHHVGDGRFNVELARSFARAGLATLRIDAHGIGDSPRAHLVAEQSALRYEDITADTSLAVEWAIKRGHPRVGLFGICSGAYMSLQVAARNPHVAALLLVNPQRFDFPDGFVMRDSENIGKGSTRAHMRSMFRPRKWVQVMRGEVGLRPVARTLYRYAFGAIASNVGALCGDAFGRAANPGARARRRMKELDARGVQVRLLYSPLDRGLDEFRLHFGPGGRRLHKLRHASMLVIQNMDHEVLNRPARLRVAAFGETFFQQAFAQSPAAETAQAAARKEDTLLEATAASGSLDPA